VDDLAGWAERDREGRWPARVGQPEGRQLRLAAAGGRERRVGLALEAALGDPGRFAVPEEDDGAVEGRRDEGLAGGR